MARGIRSTTLAAWVIPMLVGVGGLRAAELSVGSLNMLSGTAAELVVSGDIAGDSTFGVNVLVELVPRAGAVGTVTFTAAPPVDIVQLGDPWPGVGTFSPFDTDMTGSLTLNGTVDDNGTFVAGALTFSGPLSGFPIEASIDAVGVWDVVLSTSAGDSGWEGVTTLLVPATITVANAECINAADCDDGLFCNGAEDCVNNACVSGTAPCVGEELCDEDANACVECLTNADCDDGVFCNGAEACQSGVCFPGTDPCLGEICDEGAGACVECLTPEDCDDGLFCNGAEVCSNGFCLAGSAPCPSQLCDEANDVCVPCQFNSDCADNLFCNGAETCVDGNCVPGSDPCPGLLCDEATDSCLSDAAALTVQSLVLGAGSTGNVLVSGGIAGAETFGVNILLELVPRAGNTGTVTFTPAPPRDVFQVGDPWPGAGTFTAFDTDDTGSLTLNGSVDDNGTFIPGPVTFSGVLSGFPVRASSDAAGTWDVRLSTSAGDSTWEGVTTTLNAGTVSVPPSVSLTVESRAMPPDAVATVRVLGEVSGQSTFGVNILLEMVPRAGTTGTLSFTPAPPVDVVQLGDPWPGVGAYTPFDTDLTGSITLNGSVDDNGTFLPGSVTYSGPLSGFPVVASVDAEGTWDILLTTPAGSSGWEGLNTALIDGSVTVTADACLTNEACDDGNVCTDDLCVAGICQNPHNSAPCDDGDACTEGDTCVLGACIGTPVDEGTACDDGDFCTVGDVCIGGFCAGSAVDCSGLDDACNIGICNPTNGECVAAPANEGETCDDGDLCTFDDVCASGVCAGTPEDCSGLDEACLVGVCDPGTGTCLATPLPDGTECSDGDLCTFDDACFAGSCEGTPTDCSHLDDGCIVGTCNPLSGVCEAVAVNEGDRCNDGDPCTVNDTCLGGVCAGSPRDCTSLDSFCSVGVCQPSTGVCQRSPINDGASCDDGFDCTTGDVCTNGFCVGSLDGTPGVDLDLLPNLQTVMVGDTVQVELVASSATCVDQPTASVEAILAWDPATLSLVRKINSTEGNWGDSAFPNDSQLDGLNAPFTGVPANDGDAFYLAFAGFTLGSASFVPEDGQVVVTFEFEALTGTQATPLVIPATAGLFTRTRVLSAGSGAGADITGTLNGATIRIIDCLTNADCNDGNVCTTDVCNNGLCEWTNNNNPCNDGLFCTAVDVCNNGSCLGTGNSCPNSFCNETLDACVECLFNSHCVDGNVCTTDFCDANGQCVFNNNTATCNDGLFCTLTDQCSGGSCVGTGDRCPGRLCDEANNRCVDCFTNADCNDGNTCTTNTCNAQGVCVTVNNSNPCNDGLFCTQTDQCSGGACVGTGDPCPGELCSESLNACVECFTAADCSDGNPCTNDICNAGTCFNLNNTAPCNDGLFCTANDVCQSGSCVGSGDRCPGQLCDEANDRCVDCFNSSQCDDGIACTVNICSASGACVFSPNHSFCDDGLFCTGVETCSTTLGCVSAGNPCDDPGACDEDNNTCGCDPPVVVAEGSRYLAVTPASSSTPAAIRVSGDPGNSHVSCVSLYVQSDGRLGPTPFFRTPSAWGTVHVGDSQIRPSTTYEVRSDCRFQPSDPQNLSSPVNATTWRWGDINHDLVIDVLDISLLVNGFQANFSQASLWNMDTAGCSPDRVIDINDISAAVSSFQGQSFPCARPCP